MFYIDEEQGIKKIILSGYKYIKDEGYEIIKIESEELECDAAVEYFKKWLKENKLIQEII